MAVPPLLEVLVDEGAGPDAEHALAARWLERTASEVARTLCADVLAIPKLGGKVRIARPLCMHVLNRLQRHTQTAQGPLHLLIAECTI